MKLKQFRHIIIPAILIATAWMMTSCDAFNEDLPECRLVVRFKYDYNIKHADAFHIDVDKVELYVFDKDGKFLFKQSEEGAPLTTGEYRMLVEVPFGEYKFMAWAGAHGSYDIPVMTPGVSTITEMELKLKRSISLIIDKELEPLWYGEIIDVNFTGKTNQTETINLIKDTNKIRFIFQSYADDNWQLNMNEYEYEIIDSNGYLDYENNLQEDDVLSYRPYYMEQLSSSAASVDLNTMRLMADRNARFIVTEKATGKKVFSINLIDYLKMSDLVRYSNPQEYLDRQDNYHIVFFFSDSWSAVQIQINDWIWYLQGENEI